MRKHPIESSTVPKRATGKAWLLFPVLIFVTLLITSFLSEELTALLRTPTQIDLPGALNATVFVLATYFGAPRGKLAFALLAFALNAAVAQVLIGPNWPVNTEDGSTMSTAVPMYSRHGGGTTGLSIAIAIAARRRWQRAGREKRQIE